MHDFPDMRGGDPRSSPAELPKPVLNIISAASLAGQPIPPREWHVDKLIPARNVTLLSGDGATGKTLLALQLAAATVTGTSWIGQLPSKGGCLFVTAEDDMEEMHRRLADVVRGQGLSLNAMRDLHLISLAGMDALFAAPKGRSDMLEATPLFAAVEEAAANLSPVLLIIDPLADVFGGDEIRKTQARQFVGMLRGLALRLNLAVLLLSHPSQAGMASGTGTSGNVAWNNSVRARLYFEHVKSDGDSPADPDARVLSLKKSNYGPPSMTIDLRWQEGVFALQFGGGVQKDAFREQDAENAFMDLLAAFARDGRNVTSTPCPTYAPKIFSQQPQRRGFGKKDFEGAMNRLFASSRIKLIKSGPPSKQRTHLVTSDEH